MHAFRPGELFVYTNGDRWYLGMVKRANNTGNGYFCWYSTGDTATNTPVEHMHKLSNGGFNPVERDREVRARFNEDGWGVCPKCGGDIYDTDKYCCTCGSKLVCERS